MGLPCVELPRRSTAVVWSCPGLFPKRPSSVLGVPTGARCAWRRSFATITRTLAVRSISQTAALLITQPASIWWVIETGQIAESLGLCSMGSFLCNLLHLRKKSRSQMYGDSMLKRYFEVQLDKCGEAQPSGCTSNTASSCMLLWRDANLPRHVAGHW